VRHPGNAGLNIFAAFVFMFLPERPSEATGDSSNVEMSSGQSANHGDVLTQILQLKNLLDGGAITQSEFDELKRRILKTSGPQNTL
jgi:hypothetical protein